MCLVQSLSIVLFIMINNREKLVFFIKLFVFCDENFFRCSFLRVFIFKKFSLSILLQKYITELSTSSSFDWHFRCNLSMALPKIFFGKYFYLFAARRWLVLWEFKKRSLKRKWLLDSFLLHYLFLLFLELCCVGSRWDF